MQSTARVKQIIRSILGELDLTLHLNRLGSITQDEPNVLLLRKWHQVLRFS